MTIQHAPTADGGHLAFEAHGEGEPVLLLCGQGQDRHAWDPLIEAVGQMAPGRWQLIQVDPHGVGDSTAMPPAPATGDARQGTRHIAQDMVSVLDTLGVERAHLVGFSLGSRAAQWLAIDHADRLGSLVLAGSTPGLRHGLPRDPVWSRRLVNGDGAALVEGMVTPEFAATNPDAVATMLRRSPIRAAVLQRHSAAGQAHDCWAELPSIHLPTLVLHGRDDPINVAGNADLLASRIPGAELVWIEEARHAIFVSHLYESLGHLTAFWLQHPLPN